MYRSRGTAGSEESRIRQWGISRLRRLDEWMRGKTDPLNAACAAPGVLISRESGEV
ncbi:hypothetical protein [Microcoleus sp. FACHB-672]|uniref:hypothetical protein n=1 Tax=Microcoleus sp. FACHB-672 TaxID=2692825 RepID=UPI0016837972|nr:hypothetical protein [Microcoleus sp. FACHB-672]MBD2041421.1 hypothetical protein [Microcoleus sp. FACHB-672]